MPAPDLLALAEQEIRARHDAFVVWFTKGDDDAVMAETLASFAPTMAQVTPEGAILERAALEAGLRAARGQRPVDFTIAIEDVAPIWQGEDAVLVAYVERQTVDGRRTARRSTALMRRAENAPNGVVWLHVHETWMTD